MWYCLLLSRHPELHGGDEQQRVLQMEKYYQAIILDRDQNECPCSNKLTYLSQNQDLYLASEMIFVEN